MAFKMQDAPVSDLTSERRCDRVQADTRRNQHTQYSNHTTSDRRKRHFEKQA